MQPDKCAPKVTLRLLFLNSLTLAAEKMEGGCSVWHPLLRASPGGVHETNARAQIKNGFLSPPCLRRFDDAREASQHGGAPLESGTDGRKETTHWSGVTTFCLFFFHFMLITCEDGFLAHPFMKACTYQRAHPISFNASVIDDKKVTFKWKNDDGHIQANTYVKSLCHLVRPGRDAAEEMNSIVCGTDKHRP